VNNQPKDMGNQRKDVRRNKNPPTETKPDWLSQAEKEHHVAEGLCYVCHQLGHILQNCPQKTTIRGGSSKNSPPTMHQYGMGVGPASSD